MCTQSILYQELMNLACIYSPGPKWADLIKMDRKDGQKASLRIIDFIATQSDDKCDDFAELLLNDHNAVEGLRQESKDKKAFIRAVLKKWMRSDHKGADGVEPCTWESLIKIMKDADLDGVTVQAIENNIP